MKLKAIMLAGMFLASGMSYLVAEDYDATDVLDNIPTETTITVSLTGYMNGEKSGSIKSGTTNVTQKIEKFKITLADILGVLAKAQPTLGIDTNSSALKKALLVMNTNGVLVVRQSGKADLDVDNYFEVDADTEEGYYAESYTDKSSAKKVSSEGKEYSILGFSFDTLNNTNKVEIEAGGLLTSSWSESYDVAKKVAKASGSGSASVAGFGVSPEGDEFVVEGSIKGTDKLVK